MYRSSLKRWVDVVLSGAGLVVLAPLLLALALAVRVQLGKPVLFRQIRTGRNARPFRLLKFRSMRTRRPDKHGDQDNQDNEDDEHRLTAFGRWMRSTALDELPQLWNVFRGDMSLVGPRPLLPDYLAHYTPRQSRRHDVRPGVTGWAQVHGRNSVEWTERFELDVWYVDRVSPILDAAILARTVGLLARRQGVSAPGHATMPPFTGSPRRQG